MRVFRTEGGPCSTGATRAATGEGWKIFLAWSRPAGRMRPSGRCPSPSPSSPASTSASASASAWPAGLAEASSSHTWVISRSSGGGGAAGKAAAWSLAPGCCPLANTSALASSISLETSGILSSGGIAGSSNRLAFSPAFPPSRSPPFVGCSRSLLSGATAASGSAITSLSEGLSATAALAPSPCLPTAGARSSAARASPVAGSAVAAAAVPVAGSG
mmetsp:Transcript_30993/g.66618  ORF Transcript_30993/g.66618 Transcript_30993/m.66618 type:complete len:217 (-) Transcript_30993:12-662(-)